MPTSEELLGSVAGIANNWAWLAIVWHLYFGAIAIVLLSGIRPSARVMGCLLAAPLFSVSILTWLSGNPFNGTVFGLAGIALVLIALGIPQHAVRLSSPWVTAVGIGMFVFGWIYPHFLATSEFIPYLYSAPTGLIPCPTLSIVIGLTLILHGLDSRIWSLVLGTMGILYGIVGVQWLGVTLDVALLTGAIVLVWVLFVQRWGEQQPDTTGNGVSRQVARSQTTGVAAAKGAVGKTGARALLLLATMTTILGVFFLVVRPWYIHWGATAQEIEASMPGDEIVAYPASQETRAITINAGVERVWPWLAQIGQDRGGFYSFDLLENMVGCEMPTTDSLIPEKQVWQVGDSLWMYPRDKAGGIGFATLVTLIPGRALGFRTQAVDIGTGSESPGSWTFVVEPIDDATTRLLVRGQGPGARSLPGMAFDRSIFEPIHFVMERSTMVGIKQLAERGERDRLANHLLIVLWTITFGLFIVSMVMVLRRKQWKRAWLGFVASAVVFQILTLGQPAVVIAVVLVAAVVALLWAPAPTAGQLELNVMGRTSRA